MASIKNYVIPVIASILILGTLGLYNYVEAQTSIPSVTITGATLDEQTGQLQIDADFANYTSVNVGWEIAVIVFDSPEMGELQLISFNLGVPQNFEIMNFGGLGILMIENLSVGLETGKINIGAFTAGFEGQTTVGLLLRNTSDPNNLQSSLDYAYIGSQVDASPTCEKLSELIELAIIPYELSVEFLKNEGCLVS